MVYNYYYIWNKLSIYLHDDPYSDPNKSIACRAYLNSGFQFLSFFFKLLIFIVVQYRKTKSKQVIKIGN